MRRTASSGCAKVFSLGATSPIPHFPESYRCFDFVLLLSVNLITLLDLSSHLEKRKEICGISFSLADLFMDLYTWYYFLLVEILAWSKGRPSYKFYRHFQKKDHWFSQRDTRLSLFALESSLVNMILCTSAPVVLGFIFFLCT